MTPRQIQIDEDRLQKTIENAVALAFSEAKPFSFCAIEANTITDIKEALKTFKLLLVGNGDIEHGLVWKQQKNSDDLENLRKEMLTKKDLEARIDPFSRVVRYTVDKILPSLITTAIFAFIAFLIALNQNLILVKGP